MIYWFWRRRFFKVFTIYGHGGHLDHVTQLICINFHSYSPSSFHLNFGSKSPNCFWEKHLTLKSEWPLIKVNERLLTFDTHSTSLTHLAKSQCIFDFETRNKQMFTEARAFSRVTYFFYFLASQLDFFLNLHSEISYPTPFSETVQRDDTNFGPFLFYSVAKWRLKYGK